MEANNIPKPTTIVFAGGGIHSHPSPSADAFVIAADSGYDHARDHGFVVDLLIGDLDSISPLGLDHATRTGVRIERHPENKDATDLELALSVALEREPSSIQLYGGEEGRLDHLMGVVLLLTAPRRHRVPVTWHTGSGTVRVLGDDSTVEFRGSSGKTVSLVVIADSTGVTTSGLTWALDSEALNRGTTRGLSNTMTGDAASVSIERGTLLVVTEVNPADGSRAKRKGTT